MKLVERWILILSKYNGAFLLIEFLWQSRGMSSDVPFPVFTDNKVDEIHRGKHLNAYLWPWISYTFHYITAFEALSSQVSAITLVLSIKSHMH